jgi:hypothetical protein
MQHLGGRSKSLRSAIKLFEVYLQVLALMELVLLLYNSSLYDRHHLLIISVKAT